MITCSINNIDIIKALYTDIAVAFNNAQILGKEFNYDSYMKDLYKDLSKQGTPESAAKYLQSVPRLIIDVKNTYYPKVKIDLNKLDDLREQYTDTNTGINTIINSLSNKTDQDNLKATIIFNDDNALNLNQDPLSKPPVIRLSGRFKTLNPFGGSFQSYIKLDPNTKSENVLLKIENINQELLYMINVFNNIKDIEQNSDLTDGIVYEGKQLVFKAQNLNTYANIDNFKYLDKDTQNRIIASRTIIKNKSFPKNVVQVNEQVILLISDTGGNIIYFDKDGKITTSDLGKPVYQFMRTVRKNGNDFAVTNIYNTEDLLISPEDYVDATFDIVIDGSKAEYLKRVKKLMNKEMSDLYSIQNQVINGSVITLPITGITNGIPKNLSATKIYLQDILKFPGVDENIFKSIKTNPIAQNGMEAGAATININNNDFYINRPLMTNELAEEIADVLTNKDIPNKRKKDYTDQFIPSALDSKNTSKKYTLVYDKNDKFIYFNEFDSFSLKAKKLNALKLDVDALAGKTDEEINAFKKQIITLLTESGLAYNKGLTYISYNNKSLSTKTYDKFNKSKEIFEQISYVDFLKTLNAEISLTNADPGFYNYVINFTNTEDILGEVIIESSKFKVQSINPVDEANRILDVSKSKEYRDETFDPTTKVYDSFALVSYFKNQILNNYRENQTQEFVENVFNEIQQLITLSESQIKAINNSLNQTAFKIQSTDVEFISEEDVEPTEEEIINTVTVPNAPAPESKINLNDTDPDLDLFDRSKIKKEFINPLKVIQAKKWWNSKKMEPMRKLIDFDQLSNIVNSDVYARFIVAGARLADTGILGTIAVNKEMGSVFQNLTIYHESWHVFSQLFLTKKQKLDLYNELKNYVDSKGNTPYKNYKFIELEEMLAEDFRNYVKTGQAKKNSPKRNTLFRKILEFLKEVFGKVLNKFRKQSIEINSLNSPMAKEFFDELYQGNFNNYSPTIDNKLFYQLDRGPRQLLYPSQDALSPSDGKLVSDSIDNNWAVEIDKIYSKGFTKSKNDLIDAYAKQGIVPTEEQLIIDMDNARVKQNSLAMITDLNKRKILYEKTLNKFKETLQSEKDKLDNVKNIVDLNDLTDLELIKSNAIAVMQEKTGKNKYFFLTSQVKDFKNLVLASKRGERVKGNDYKDSIKIVGDFYKHTTIRQPVIDSDGKKTNALVDIVIVSRPEDAEAQYNNYVKGGAKIFTKFIKSNKNIEVTPILEQEQEFILDNIRILQTAIDNWGDEKSGIVKYHMENTDFEVAKKVFTVNESDELEDLDETSTVTNEQENKTGTASLQQMMSKDTIAILKTLFKVDSQGNFSTNRLGFRERADFSKIFAIVAKTIGGIRDREQAYNELRKESLKSPELKQLFDTKFPNPKTITHSAEFDISRQFFQDFGKPQIEYQQLYAFHNDDSKNKSIDFIVKEANYAKDTIVNNWLSSFVSASKSKFVNVDSNNLRTLNLEAVVKEFKETSSNNLNLKKQFEFAKAIGINLSNNDNIKNELKDNAVEYGLPYMFNFLYKINTLQQTSKNETLTQDKLNLLSKFIKNPVNTLRQGFLGGPIAEEGIIKQATQLNRLANLEVKYGFEKSATAIIRSNQNVGYQEVNWSAGHANVYSLNQVDELQQLWNDPRYNNMSHLNPEINTHTKHLKIMTTLFDFQNGKKRPSKSVKFFAQDGITYTDRNDVSTGNITTELDPLSKFIFELHTMMLGGNAEIPRTSDKKFSFGLKLEGGINVPQIPGLYITSEDKNLYIDTKLFASNQGETLGIGGYMFGYLQGEFDRIQKFRGPNRENYLKIKGYNNQVTEFKEKEKFYAGEVFSVFNDILSDTTKKELYALADQQNNIPNLLEYLKANNSNLKTEIVKNIQNYFNKKSQEYKRLYYDKLNYISDSLLIKTGVNRNDLTEDKRKSLLANENLIKQIIKSYAYNDWIHKYETSIIMFGDHAQWNHGKQEWSKRIPGLTSDGIGFLFDVSTSNFINQQFNKVTYASLLEKETGINYNNLYFSETMNSAVIKDANRESIYAKEYEENWTKSYEKTFSKEESKIRAAKDRKAYDDMKESDGIAYVTLDMYRTLKKVGRGWSKEEDAIYQDIINKKEIDPLKVKEFFSIYKLHYFGTIKNNLLPVTGMYKFAVLPLIPGVNAIEGSGLDDLHKKMLKQNIQLVTFESGSKASFITSDGKTDNAFGDSLEKSVNTRVNDKGEDEFIFTNNPIYLSNLKEVTVMNNYFKSNLSVATQTRAITIDNLFDKGELKNPDNKEAVDNYTQAITNYSLILKEELLNGLGIELIDGRVIGDLTKFVEIIRKELNDRDVPVHLQKLINTDLDGKLALDLSLHPESNSIEKLIVSFIQKGLIKQKTNGEPLIMAPTTFTNGIWDTQYNKLTEIKEIQKLLGTNTLPFYIINSLGEFTRTEEMKIAISLQGSFINLLKAKDLEGNEIKTIDRLNELIKTPEWFLKNKKSLTVFGPRIPNDAHNTIEAATVWHFLDTSFGNTIITSTELVAKAGSDHDGDKLFMSMPNIDSEGNYIDSGVVNFKKELNKTRELEKSKKLPKGQLSSNQLIQKQKKYLQNKYLEASVEILMLPENSVTLTKPNGTYLVDKYATDLLKDKFGYDKNKNIDGSSYTNMQGDAVPSPTRHMELGYNLYVHDANLSLEPALGILAKLTKSIPMFKAAGAKMVPDIIFKNGNVTKFSVPLKMRFAKNTIKNKLGIDVISLSNEQNIVGENISDVTSHSLQGILDRAKDSFPFELKLVPEAMTAFGYTLRAGMDIEEIIFLLNQPLVSKYLANQKINDGVISNILSGKKKNYEIANEIALDTLKIAVPNPNDIARLINTVNTLKLNAVLDNLSDETNLIVTQLIDKQFETSLILVKDLKNLTKIGNVITNIKLEDINETEIYYRLSLKNVKSLFNKENIYFTNEILSSKFDNKEQISKTDLSDILKSNDTTSLKALSVFLHFLEIENQYADMTDLETSFAPDTTKLITTQEIVIRLEKFKSFYESSMIDQDFLEELINNSVISSLIVDKESLQILEPLFGLKLNKNLSSYLSNIMFDADQRNMISILYGPGYDGRAKFYNAFNNNLLNSVFQNFTSNFYDKNGLLVNVPESVNKLPTEINDTINSHAVVTDGKLLVNSRMIEVDFVNKSYLEKNSKNDNYFGTRNLDTFATDPFVSLKSFYRYNIEKAILESKNDIDTLYNNDDYFRKIVILNNEDIDAAYIKYISERALINSFNSRYIFGQIKYSYTDNLLEIIQSFENNNIIKDTYPILSQIGLLSKSGNNKIIKLNNRREVKGQLAQDYFTQIRQLADITVKKVENTNKNNRISDLFGLFSIMMYYQHGIGSSSTGFINALDSTQYKPLMEEGYKAFLNNYFNTNTLNIINGITLQKKPFSVINIDADKYVHADAAAAAAAIKNSKDIEEGEDETFDDPNVTTVVKKDFIKGESIIFSEDVSAYKNYLAKSVNGKPRQFFTSNTLYKLFYDSTSGKNRTMPNSAIWMLNDNTELYDMIDKDSGEVYYENVDLETGFQMIDSTKPPVSNVEPVSTGKVIEGKPVFSSLPEKSITPTMFYAGIGSRETPQEVLDTMTKVATYLESLGYTLNTGKTFKARPSTDPRYQKQYEERLAFSKKYDGKVGLDEEGADRAFSLGATKKNLFGVDTPIGTKEMQVMEEIHPNPNALKEGAKKLMARNTNQVFGANLDTPVDFVLFYAKETDNPLRPKGGTGQAVEMARRKGIPTINMADTNWRDQLKTVLANKPTQSSTSVETEGVEVYNNNGLTIIEKGLSEDFAKSIVPDLIQQIESQSYKQTKSASSYDFGLRWTRMSDTLSKDIKLSFVTGMQLSGYEITKEKLDRWVAGEKGAKLGLPPYGYNTLDQYGKPLAKIPASVILAASNATGIDLSTYQASYNSVYDNNDQGNLIFHQDNTEQLINAPIVTLSLGLPMKFVAFELKNEQDFTLNNQFIADPTLPTSTETLKNKFINPKGKPFILSDRTVLVFDGKNRNVGHKIEFDSSLKGTMPDYLPEVSVNKAFTGLNQKDRYVKTKDYRTVLTLRKVTDDGKAIKKFDKNTQELVYKNGVYSIVSKPTQSSTSVKREYTPENITTLKPNEVFVFGANTAGGHGGGTAGLAQRGTTSSNYTALPVGTKGKWSEYGIVDKLMQGTEGKSFGIVTKAATISDTSLKIGAKRSVPLSRIEESINALIKTASENPSLKFLVTKFGTNMAGFSEQEMKSLLENKNLPDNIILPKEFEVRTTTQPSTSVKPTIDLSREWSEDLKTRLVYTAEGVNTMRTEVANKDEHFGNPFSEAGYGGTIKVASIGEAVVAYKEWLLGTNHQNVKPQQREWILDQINQGKLDGATLLYAGKSEARGQGMHPTALAEVVEELRGAQPTVQPVGEIKPGVAELFESNPELANIGTPEQYSQYLDTVFPDSKVKDIVYHWSVGSQISEQFGDDLGRVKGVWISKDPNQWKDIIKNKSKRLGINEIKKHILIINANNVWVDSTLSSPNGNNFPKGYDTIAAYEEADLSYSGDLKPEFKNIEGFEAVIKSKNQTYELGSKQDIEGFKNFVLSKPTTQPSTSVKPIVKDLSRWADIKDATTPYTDKGIVVTRVGNTEEQFGNPFIGSKRRDKQGNLVESKVDNITVFNTIDEADQAYRDWLMGTKHQNIKPLRREWILKQINEGKLDGKTLLYYKPMDVTNNDGSVVRGGYHSHADTLAEIVEQLRGIKPSTGVERNIKVDQYNITIQPDGTMFYENGNEVTDETIQNKANIRKELQDGTLRTSSYNNSEYYILSNNKILGSGKTNLGKESVANDKIKNDILAKAILYKKSCNS